MSVAVLVKNVFQAIGEAPHWDEEKQLLYMVDIQPGDVHIYNPASGDNKIIHVGSTLGAVFPRTKGGLVVCHNHGLCGIDEEGKTDVMIEVDQGKNTRLNDAKCDASGRLWAGTMGLSPRTVENERFLGSLYSINPDLTVTSHVSNVGISNGLAWTPDNKTMYYIDSLPRKVYRFDFDLESGKTGFSLQKAYSVFVVENQRTIIDFDNIGPTETYGSPDGMCMDTDGNLWVATFGGGRVINFDPHTGKYIRDIKIEGAKKITSCCFGGKNLDELYVTSANWPSGLRDIPDEGQPLAGSVFKVTGLGVKGVPVSAFKG